MASVRYLIDSFFISNTDSTEFNPMRVLISSVIIDPTAILFTPADEIRLYLPFHAGDRFSRKDRTPSLASSVLLVA